MKKTFPVLLFLITYGQQSLFAQTSAGIITYQIKTNMHRSIPEHRQQMMEMVPEFNIEEARLHFDADESFYKPVEADTEPDMEDNSGPSMRIRRPRNEIYVNLNELRIVSLREFMGKKYVVEDTLRMRPWKIGTETREIEGYLCRKASFADEERKINVVAWYTDALRPFLGPDSFNTLPGAVLLVDVNDGERILSAKAIDLRPLKENEIRMPGGKLKMTEQEYRDMVTRQMERIRANGGNVIIRN